jgi:hypothetical protein
MDQKISSLQSNSKESADCINVMVTKMLSPSYSKTQDLIRMDQRVKVVRDLSKIKTMVDQDSLQNKVKL